MRNKPNQRIALTKELIHRALILLLKTQDIHKISIRELCDIAGINRSTPEMAQLVLHLCGVVCNEIFPK